MRSSDTFNQSLEKSGDKRFKLNEVADFQNLFLRILLKDNFLLLYFKKFSKESSFLSTVTKRPISQKSFNKLEK